jgi:putative lipoic acid-binding regulatory protein
METMPDNEKKKVQLEYPCHWVYKIIGPNENQMRSAVAEIICDRTYKISLSHSSEKAKYQCLNIELSVESESHRMALYEALKTNPSIKVVL